MAGNQAVTGAFAVVVHGWPEVVPTSNSAFASPEIGQPIQHYATIIPLPADLRRGSTTRIEVCIPA